MTDKELAEVLELATERGLAAIGRDLRGLSEGDQGRIMVAASASILVATLMAGGLPREAVADRAATMVAGILDSITA